MEKAAIIIAAFSGMFTFAFGMAWILPLSAARSEPANPPSRSDWLFGCIDLVLCLLDCIPVFWIVRGIPKIPSEYAEVREKWRAEKSIRVSFYLFLISGIITFGAGWFMFP